MRIQTGKDIGPTIRALRAERGWTQQELADKLGRSRHWVMNTESGRTNADFTVIVRALRLLGATLRVERLRELDAQEHPEGGARR